MGGGGGGGPGDRRPGPFPPTAEAREAPLGSFRICDFVENQGFPLFAFDICDSGAQKARFSGFPGPGIRISRRNHCFRQFAFRICDFGAILGPFGGRLGAIWGAVWGQFGEPFGGWVGSFGARKGAPKASQAPGGSEEREVAPRGAEPGPTPTLPTPEAWSVNWRQEAPSLCWLGGLEPPARRARGANPGPAATPRPARHLA